MKTAAPPAARRLLRVGEPELFPFTTADGVSLRLTRYQGGARGPVVLVHCIGVSSTMYSLDTVETNLLEYLYAESFDVWLLDMRLSTLLPACARQSSFDEIALYDFPAAVDKVLKVTGAESIQAVTHGIGSQTFCMAMLGGLQGVRSAICSQVAIHPLPAGLNRVKAYMGFPALMRALGVDSLSAVPDEAGGWSDRALGLGSRLHPIAAEECCQSDTCRRITAMYGPLYEHDALNVETHDALPELFGRANLRAFQHLIRNLRVGQVVREDGANVYVPNAERMAIPIAFLHGAENTCLRPESTLATEQMLAERNGAGLYRRHVFPNYGHVDCIIGDRAHRDVYPFILAHLMETATDAHA
ncbi:MAG TPA: hypothetical protein VFI91_06735 [Longimicrobiaceae bacterium]|nr:hypothetical protein [Longimicrobiaceae bacterium]